MEIEVTTGNYEIIGSGTIVANYNTPVEFNFSTLTYVFQFSDDLLSSSTRIEYEQFKEKKGLTIKFINFNNALGLGSSNPLSIGNINNRKLFLNYRIYTLSENLGKTIHYTFLLEKKN
ncbi:MAG TPA: hypothetical protein VK623_03440 [Flavobacterium sp.]|nr:hypothetical protein [Flavobacterium sp.]